MKKIIKSILMQKEKTSFLKLKEKNKQIQMKNDFQIIKEREKLFKTKDLALNRTQKEVVANLVSQGFSSHRLNEIYTDADELIQYLQKLCETTRGKSYEELVIEHNYNESKEYWVNLYHPKEGETDPIKKFMSSPEIFNIASRYLGEIPRVAMLSLLYTPPTEENYKNSMMWHLDNHNDNIVRIFINPYDITSENGPTMIFPNKYQPVYDFYKRFPYFTDEEAQNFGFNFNDKVELTAASGHAYFADSANCFHCGSRSKKERFLAILTFVPYLHYNEYENGFFNMEFKKYSYENQVILDYFKR